MRHGVNFSHYTGLPFLSFSAHNSHHGISSDCTNYSPFLKRKMWGHATVEMRLESSVLLNRFVHSANERYIWRDGLIARTYGRMSSSIKYVAKSSYRPRLAIQEEIES